jgi:aspartyl-tRNA synthetase
VLRTHLGGHLRASDAGQRVVLAGWVHRRRDHGGLIFIDLRDSAGPVQVVFHPDRAPEAFATASDVRSEYVLRVWGEVAPRRDGTENPELPTGAIEVIADQVVVLNASETPPFPVNQETSVDEMMRLRYRYLDLRRERMTANLRLRHRIVKYIRDYMDARGFAEVETPVLNLATPEGARDYLVPSRVHPGSFYALPQSPQQWKQLLMVAGLERYFQIARCYRDEDLRADRQPEFTQLDVEMSFVDEEDVLVLLEELHTGMVQEIAPAFRIQQSPFPRFTYQEAMERYGSDKPDLRYGLEFHDLTPLIRGTDFVVFKSIIEAGGRIRGFAVPGAGDMARRALDALTEAAREAGAQGLVTVAFAGEGPLTGLTADDVKSPVARFFTPEQFAAWGAECGASRGDLLLVAAGPDALTSRVLDVLRRRMAEDRGLADPGVLAFAFVTEFPMFEWDDADQKWNAVHHLFTAPFESEMALIDEQPEAVRSRAYDLVCNGWEMGGGSIRIHRPDALLRVLARLGIEREEAAQKFGHMLEAFTLGAPPHGGFATGIDRTVALLAGEHDIREVIAFPKTKSASDMMTGAPSPVSDAQLRDAHIAISLPPSV